MGSRNDKSSQKRSREPVNRDSGDPGAERLGALRDLYPEAFNEGRIDVDKLRVILGDDVDEGPERYSFTWAGKRDAIRLLQTPSRATLVPDRDKSVEFDSTQHVFIEGENLETLKLLRRAYAGQVKMIYIDPPYNTGNDFIYPDDFKDPLGRYLQLTGQTDEAGNLLTSNPETSGRYHSAWLSMMYPRLFLARQLLRDDGVIFVSIDDHEVHNLRLLMNEIFGEENFVTVFVWKSRQSEDTRARTGVSSDHEYVVVYRRSVEGELRGAEKDMSKFSNPDNDPRGDWRSADLTGLATRERRPNLHYDLVDPATGISYECPPKGWRFEKATMARKIAEGRILFPANGQGRPRHKLFLDELGSLFKNISSVICDITTSDGTRELNELFGRPVFQFPKPSELMMRLVQQVVRQDEIVIDFFAGVASTAHGVLRANHGGLRARWVCVQLPERIDTTGCSTLTDLAEERMRRVTAQLDVSHDHEQGCHSEPADTGFRVFRLAASSFRQWEPVDPDDPEGLMEQMELFVDPLLDGWRPEDVLWEVALKEGYALHSRVEQLEDVAQNSVWRVTDPDKEQSFLICIDHEVQEATVAALRLSADDLFVCRDVALSDTLAANLALQCRLKTI